MLAFAALSAVGTAWHGGMDVPRIGEATVTLIPVSAKFFPYLQRRTSDDLCNVDLRCGHFGIDARPRRAEPRIAPTRCCGATCAPLRRALSASRRQAACVNRNGREPARRFVLSSRCDTSSSARQCNPSCGVRESPWRRAQRRTPNARRTIAGSLAVAHALRRHDDPVLEGRDASRPRAIGRVGEVNFGERQRNGSNATWSLGSDSVSDSVVAASERRSSPKQAVICLASTTVGAGKSNCRGTFGQRNGQAGRLNCSRKLQLPW